MKTNGNGHAISSLVVPTTTLVGAKRRKCNIAHRINLEDKVIDQKSSSNCSPYVVSFRIMVNHHHSIIHDDQVMIDQISSPIFVFSSSKVHHRFRINFLRVFSLVHLHRNSIDQIYFHQVSMVMIYSIQPINH